MAAYNGSNASQWDENDSILSGDPILSGSQPSFHSSGEFANPFAPSPDDNSEHNSSSFDAQNLLMPLAHSSPLPPNNVSSPDSPDQSSPASPDASHNSSMTSGSAWSRRADTSSRSESRASSEYSPGSSVQVLSGRSASFTVRDDVSMASPLDLRYIDDAFGAALQSPLVPDEDALMAEVSNVSSLLFAANQSHLSRLLMGSPSADPEPAQYAEPEVDPSLPTHTVACVGPVFVASPHVGPPHAIVPVPPAQPSPTPFFYHNADWQLADWYLCGQLGVPIEKREHVMIYRPACCTSVLHGQAVWSELQAKLNYVNQVVCLTPETYKSVTGTTFTSYLRDGLNYPLKMKDMPLVRLWDGFLAPLESLLVHLVPPCSSLY